MLFSSYEFIFLFLPIALLGFFLFCRIGIKSLVTGWLILISIGFYAYWNLSLLLLLLFSITTNWLICEAIVRRRAKLADEPAQASPGQPRLIQTLLVLGLIFNLGLLAYFKYSNFFLSTINSLGASWGLINDLVLPLGISFYTFQQISYLVGVATGKDKHYGLHRFLLFVTFFPNLSSGPIVRAEELIPQLRSLNYRFNVRNIALGVTLFAIGLFKKIVIADSIAGYATPIFAMSEQGHAISFFLAWQAAIAYSLQLYFDFSGYSDMAIGIAKMFNIKLPMNFFSPYKAIGIVDFWRRWHISLSRFLRDYLYIPLGGSRKGQFRRNLNLLITMLLGGLWHGANWTFILWGGLHGAYLCIDSGWQQFLKSQGWKAPSDWLSQTAARALTFLAVVISWIVFRAETLQGAGRILRGIVGLDGFILPESFAAHLGLLTRFGVEFGTVEHYGDVRSILIMLSLLAGVFLLPNVYELMQGESVVLDVYHHLDNKPRLKWGWRPTPFYAVCVAILLAIGIGFCNRPSEFLYFQF